MKEAPHHSGDAVVSQVEFSETVQTLQVLHSADAVSCQVQHSQLAQMRHAFYPADLCESTETKHDIKQCKGEHLERLRGREN